MKAQFISIPEMVVTHLQGVDDFRRAVKLKGMLTYDSAAINKRIYVPTGFVSDGASVPQIFWSRYPPFGQYLEAAIVHDRLCQLGKLKVAPCDSRQAAEVFKEAMEVVGYSWWGRNVMYLAVLVFGPRF